MPASVPAHNPDRPSGPDPLLRALVWTLRANLVAYLGVIFLSGCLSLMGPSPGGWIGTAFFGLIMMQLFNRATAAFAQSSRWLLPLGDRRTAVYLWLCQVPLVPCLVTLASLPVYFLRGASSPQVFLDYAQHGLWAAGFLALLSAPFPPSAGKPGSTRWIILLVLCGFASYALASGLTPVISFFSAIASGRYDPLLNLLSAAMIALSFWALRSDFREYGASKIPWTEQDTARGPDLQGGSGRRVFSGLSGGIRMDRLSGHLVPQLFARCVLGWESAAVVVFTGLVNLFNLYWMEARTQADTTFFMLGWIELILFRVDPRLLRRLPLGASTITVLTVLPILYAAVLFSLPPLAFERIAGSFSVRLTLPQVFSLHALGVVVASAGKFLIGWIIAKSFSRYGDKFTVPAWIGGIGFLWISSEILEALHESWGWRSDLAAGAVLLLLGAVVHFLMLRWTTLLYKPAHKDASSPGM